jgi:hypothetical protein
MKIHYCIHYQENVYVLDLKETIGAVTLVGLDNTAESPILLLLTNKSIPTVSADDPPISISTLLREVSMSRLTSSILFVLLFIGISFILYIYATEKIKIKLNVFTLGK